MFLYMEWVISICSIFILWWKFGWKSLAVMKKMEDIVFPITTKSKTHSTESSASSNDFLNLPVVRTQFTPKMSRTFNEGQNGAVNGNVKSSNPIRAQTELLSLRHRKQRRIIGPTRQTSCTACSKHQVKSHHLHDKDDLRDSLHCETHLAHNPWYIRRFASIVHYWRKWYLAYQYHMVSLKDMMGDARVNAAVQEVARKEVHESGQNVSLESAIRKQKFRAERITVNLRAIQDMKYFRYFSRFAIWFVAKLLSRIYPKILVRQSQLESLRKARESGYRLIYLPIHRSHIDYVLISWILSSNDIRSPLVAAGDNLNIPIFNKMMRSVGGFFIKRQMDQKDTLYRAILHSYMERTIVDDNDLEFFIEGGRTRTGKPGLPKGGLLNIAMDTLFSGQVEDMLIVPVNFSYEKLIEGNYVREQLGKPKVNESFLAAVIGVWNSCQTKFGNARIDFGQPFSVKEFMNSYKSWNSPTNNLQLTYITDENDNQIKDTNKDLNIYREGRLCRSNSFALSGTSAQDTTIIEDRRNFINCLAQHVIYDGLKCFSLMSTNVLAFLLLNKYRSGVTLDKLAAEMHTLKLEFLERKHDVNLDGDMKEVIIHALNILGPTLVSQEIVPAKSASNFVQGSPGEVYLRPNTAVPSVIDLAYYSTCVTPLYAMEAVIATSLLVLAKSELSTLRTYPQEIHLSDYELVSTCMELCDILEYEFIFHPPCQTLEQAIRNNLEYMKTQGIIRFKHSQVWEEVEDDSSDSLRTSTIQLLLTKENHERLKFLHGLLQSILDNYAVSSLVLKRLIGHEAKEKQLQMDMLAEVKYHLQKKMIAYGESLALDPIRNFIRVLLEWQVLESSTKEKVLTYSLQEPFDNEPTVYDLIRKIRRFQV